MAPELIEPGSFYVSGGTLRADARCYVERSADAKLFDGLARGEFCYVLDARQMGKSSLMSRTASRLRDSGCKVVVLDLSELGQNLTVEQWYYGLLIRLGEQLDIEDELLKFWKSNPEIGPLQRWMTALRKIALEMVSGPVVVFVDEIDVVRSLGFSTDEFFAGIRECYNRRTEDPNMDRISFCLLGVATPADLIRDVRTTPFNIGQRIELTDFSESEAAPLTVGLAEGGRDGAKLLKRILYWTGGHPYLTQRLCQAIAESPDVTTPAGVDRICEALFLTKSARDTDDNLSFVRNRILRSEADLAALLDLYAQVRNGKRRIRDDDANPFIDLLRLAGIVRVVEGYLWVRNRIYFRVFDKQWVFLNTPDAELIRQRRAYWVGVGRAAGIAAVVVAIIGWLALSRQVALVAVKQSEAKAWVESKMRGQAVLVAQSERDKAKNESLAKAQALTKAKAAESRAKAEQTKAELSRRQALASAVSERQQRHIAEQKVFAEARLRYVSDMRLAQESWDSDPPNPARTIELLERHLPGHGDPVDFRGFEWGYLWNQGHQELLILRGHIERVASASFSPNGRQLATAGWDGKVWIWDAATGRKLTSLRGQGNINSESFSPDGKLLLTAQGGRADAIIWDIDAGKAILYMKGHKGTVHSASFSPDGRRVVTAGQDGTARIWDAHTGRELIALKGHDEGVFSASFSPDGKRVVTASFDCTARIWDAETGRYLISFKSHTGIVCSASFSPDGRRVVSASSDGTARIWDAVTARELVVLKGRSSVLSASFSPDGRRVVTADSAGIVRIWDANTVTEYAQYLQAHGAIGNDDEGRELLCLKGHTGGVNSAFYSPDGKRVVTAGGDETVRVWNAITGRECVTLKNHTGMVMAAAFSPDGNMVVTAGEDKTARIWDAVTGRESVTLKGHTGYLCSASFSPDGNRVVTASEDKTVRVWDAITGRECVTLNGYTDMVRAAAFSPDGRLVLTGTRDGVVQIWYAVSGRKLVSLNGFNWFASFSPDGKRVVTARRDGTARIWEVNTGRELNILKGHTSKVLSASFSPDGTRVVTADDGNMVRIWDAATGRKLVSLKGFNWSASFSPDGKRVVTLSDDNSVKMWDVVTGRELVSLKGNTRVQASTSFSPDGTRVVTADDFNTVRIWDADTGRELISLKGNFGLIRSVSFSPDGKRVVIASYDRTAVIWNGDVAAIDRKLASEKAKEKRGRR